jgi:hypothetical protein
MRGKTGCEYQIHRAKWTVQVRDQWHKYDGKPRASHALRRIKR